MKLSWEQLVDYVRGLATPEVVAAVESDPEVAEKVQALRAVQRSHDPVPDWMMNRARALIPAALEAARPSWRAVLGFDSAAGLAFGLRSTGALARDLQFQFENGDLDLRLEPGVAIGALHWSLADDLSAVEGRAVLSDGTQKSAWCRETGEFEVELDVNQLESFEFTDHMTGNSVHVSLEKETS